jgi:hypothetical protein
LTKKICSDKIVYAPNVLCTQTEREKMKTVTSLETMEDIVKNHKQLSWDGWTVIETFLSEKAMYSKFGIYKNGKWQMKKQFIPSNKGWEIPDKYVR